MRKGRISPKKSTLRDLEEFIDPADTSLNTPVISNYNTLSTSYQNGGETDPPVKRKYQIPANLMQQHRNEVKLVESADGTLMKNPQSTATGFYGQLFSEVQDLPEMRGVSRDEFAADTALQNQVYNRRFEEGLPGIPSTSGTLDYMYNEYGPQIKEKGHGPMDTGALTNFIGRGGVRKYYGYHVRDGKPLSDVFPSLYGAGKNQANKTPDEYIEEMRSIRPEYAQYNYSTDRYGSKNQVKLPYKPYPLRRPRGGAEGTW